MPKQDKLDCLLNGIIGDEKPNEDIKSWEDVLWSEDCVNHFLYRMPSVQFPRRGRITDPDPNNLYVPQKMKETRDKLLVKHKFDIGEYTKLGDQFLRGETSQERLEAQKKLFEMFTPIYFGLQEAGFSNEELFG